MSTKRRTFTTEFKKQVVALYENGKSRKAITEEYELTASALDGLNNSGKQVLSKRKTTDLQKNKK